MRHADVRRALLLEIVVRDLDRFRKFLGQLFGNRLALAGLGIIVFFTVLSFSAPLLVGHYPSPLESGSPNQAPSWSGHWLGTDIQGRDTLTLLIYGGQVSLIIGLVASLVAMILGTTVGLVGGFYRGTTDQLLARATDFFLVIPWLPFVLILVLVLGSSLGTIIVAIAVVSWPTTARVIRSQVLTLKERQFIERSRSFGAGNLFIIRKHILPNVMPLVWAEAVLTVSNSVFTEAFLSFFGLGATGVYVSWGTMVNDSYHTGALLLGRWWYFGPPGIFITLVVLGFAMLGYGLEEILNPALRRRR
ncbi:MAG TPA: ABC transporter permease [Thermoplasmata archaeon]|nr:ABC transporter permease [Thermoplasmata archaeon]